MHLIALLLNACLTAQAQPVEPIQVWEKRIAPGLVYRMEWDPATPRILNALRISLREHSLHATSQLAGGTVFEDNASKGRATVTQMVRADHAIAGINGDLFPFTGDPLGLLVRDGELVSAPFQSTFDPAARRAALGWGDGYSAIGLPDMVLRVTSDTGSTIDVDGLDEDGGPDRVTLDFPPAGLATAKAPNAFAIVSLVDGRLTPSADITGTIKAVGADLTSRAVEPNSVILLGTGKAAAKLNGLQAGETLHIHAQVGGFDFSHVSNVVGGGPILLKNGQVVVDYVEERFKKGFANLRHPRTAVGRTASGDLWLVTIDGRSSISAGATLTETAEIMKRLGCVDAINVDGGGSTTFNLFGQTINWPSDGIERPVASSVLVSAKPPIPTSDVLSLSKLPAGVRPNAVNHLSVLIGRPDAGLVAPNAAVVWTCTGAAWIDQGGDLHVRGAGIVSVTAIVRGVTVHGEYKVVGANKEPERPNPGGKGD